MKSTGEGMVTQKDGRREFVKKAAVAGLAAFGTAVGAACGSPEAEAAVTGPATGALDATEANLFRYVLARTELPIAAWDPTLAAATLARDLFTNRKTAETFAANPQAYWNQLGLSGVHLDVDAIEVRLAAAIGDPEGRALIAAKDYAGYIGYLERKGLLDLRVDSGLSGGDSGVVRQGMRNRCIELGDCDPAAVYAVAFLLVVVAVTWVTVAYTAAAAMMIEVGAGVQTVAVVSTSTVGTLRYDRAPALSLLSALGGPEASLAGTEAYVAENVERIASELERSETYIRRGGPVGTALRDLVRSKLQLAMALPAA